MKSSNRTPSNRSQRKLRRDLETLALFTSVYCNKHHPGPKQALEANALSSAAGEKRYSYCSDCRALLRYAVARRQRCPLEPKPACRNCPCNCYGSRQRVAMRRIMAFAGPYLIFRGRVDLLWRLYFG
ncbi:MAG: nitrous oxide-stimulated promoter family protein [Syntrophotaleaceae bacterium]